MDDGKDEPDWDRTSDLTPDEVKAAGFNDLTDEEAIEVIEFIKAFCTLCYTIHLKNKENDNDEPLKEAA